jgi:multiple sugar transport system substrate-binding protein
VFCYVSYSRAGHPGARVAFGDMPVMNSGDAPSGSLLGGAGLAVSAYGEARQEALDYCMFVASSDEQCGTYFASGGQPAHPQAWSSPELDRKSGGFFSGVGPTMRGAWTRPTGPNFAEFQNAMIDLFAGWYDEALAPEGFLDQLDALYRRWARTGKVAQ